MKKLICLIFTGIILSFSIFSSCATTTQEIARLPDVEEQLKLAGSTVNRQIDDKLGERQKENQAVTASLSKIADLQDISEPVVHDAIQEIINTAYEVPKTISVEEPIAEPLKLEESFFITTERPVVAVTKAADTSVPQNASGSLSAPEASPDTRAQVESAVEEAKPADSTATVAYPSSSSSTVPAESDERKPSTSYAVLTATESTPKSDVSPSAVSVETTAASTVSPSAEPVSDTKAVEEAGPKTVEQKPAETETLVPIKTETLEITKPASTRTESVPSVQPGSSKQTSTVSPSKAAATSASTAKPTSSAASTPAATAPAKSTAPAETATRPSTTTTVPGTSSPSASSAKSSGTATTVAKNSSSKKEKSTTPTEVTEDKSEPASETKASPSKQKQTGSKNKAEPSRTVTMGKSQYLDITYPGNGWIYLGETDDKALMRYFGRKLGDEDTSFTMRSREEGTTLLHFYKNDPLTGTFLDDYLEVVITGENMDGTRITAPEYAAVIPGQPSIYATMTKPYPEGEFVEIEPEIITLPPLNPVSVAVTDETTDSEGDSSTGESTATEESAASPTPASDSLDKSEETSDVKKEQETSTSSDAASETAASSSSSGTAAQTPKVEDDSKVTTVIQNTSDEEELYIPATTSEPARPTDGSLDAIIGSTSTILENEISSYTTDELLKLATQAYKAKKYDQALDYLHEFFNSSVTRIDEGLFLQGQVLEANSSVRNIKGALDSYETLVKNYPASENWQAANERIIYINRFYFNKR